TIIRVCSEYNDPRLCECSDACQECKSNSHISSPETSRTTEPAGAEYRSFWRYGEAPAVLCAQKQLTTSVPLTARIASDGDPCGDTPSASIPNDSSVRRLDAQIRRYPVPTRLQMHPVLSEDPRYPTPRPRAAFRQAWHRVPASSGLPSA